MELGAIGQISLPVDDVAEAERFYGEILGLPHLYTYGKLAFFDAGGTRLYLTAEAQDAPRASVLYFRVDDIEAAHAALAAAGVAFSGPPHMIFQHADGLEEWMAFFEDPFGNLLALMSQLRGAG